MLEAFLSPDDARRATSVVERLSASGLTFALTGGLAIEAQLRAHERWHARRPLNDLDLVVASAESLRDELADGFLISHIHPRAAEGKLLAQLVHREHRLRMDVFRAFGKTLSRARRLDAQTGNLDVLTIEDLRARSTAHVCMCLRSGLVIDIKYVEAFRRLIGCGDSVQLREAWNDHRQDVPGTLADASETAHQLLTERPDLLVVEEYSRQKPPCDKCHDHGSLRLAKPEDIAAILGYS